MDKITRFQDGDWIVTLEGICQVYGSADYYVEKFFEHEFENIQVGDVCQNKVVYKIFCDFDGMPRKTKFFSYSLSNLCDPLEGEYQKIFELCKAKNPDHYDKFITRKPSKPITSRVEFALRFEPDVREQAKAKINELLNDIPKPFCYEEFESYLKNHMDIELPEKLYAKRDAMMTNILVSLVYNVLEPRNEKFSFVGGVAVKTFCSYDEKQL